MDQTQQAVIDLQRMLNQLSRRYPAIPRLVENGIFDETTLEAVMVFQRDFFPPVTGVVDENTWYAIVDAFQQDQLQHGVPLALRVLPNGDFSAEPGEMSAPTLIAEAIFRSLPSSIVNFNRSGHRENLMVLQQLAGLPENGILNRATWDFLARLYHAFVTRSALSFRP